MKTNVKKIGAWMFEAAVCLTVISVITWILGSVFTTMGLAVDTEAVNFICSEKVLAVVGIVGFAGLIMQKRCKGEGSDE